MSSTCDPFYAHAYDTSDSFLTNMLGDVTHDIYGGTYGPCSGFLPAMGFGTMALSLGVIAGLFFWNSQPRLSGALLAGCGVFWVLSKIVAFQTGSLIYVYSQGYAPDEARSHYATGAVHQSIFELLVFAALPISVAFVIRSRRASPNRIQEETVSAS